MDKDIYETPDGVKLRWLGRDLSHLIRMCAERYKQLLENPDFKHQEFMETGGFPLLLVYKSMLESLVLSECESHATINIQECLSYATRIEEIYRKRWGMK